MERIVLPAAVVVAVLLSGCSTQKKISLLRTGEMVPVLSKAPDGQILPVLASENVARDTIRVRGENGRDVFIMKAVRDENGEMVANDRLDAAVVSARFSNVAERQGQVDLCFRVRVPAAMRDSRWQMILYPRLSLSGEDIPLKQVVITGKSFRKAQLRGYQQYERFLSRILPDTTSFVRRRELEIFLKRNIPAFYAFRTDSTFVSDEQVAGAFGVSGKDALDHYTDRLAMALNEHRKGLKERMFRRFVKHPVNGPSVRVDTLVTEPEADFIYDYVQTVPTRPGLRKAEVFLSGEILEQDHRIYSIPEGEALTFYISTLATLAEDRERFLEKIVERRAEAHTACYVCFEAGKSTVVPALGDNTAEIGRIKQNIKDLTEAGELVLDSVVVRSSASPEGSLEANLKLSGQRSRAISEYLDAYLDSLENLRPAGRERICFLSRSDGENWEMLDRLVETDTLLTAAEKRRYGRAALITDPDRREASLRRERFYRYLREHLYPRLRTVKFDFYLHRRDMIKDTVHTTIPDTVYRDGVRALKDMDYLDALQKLGPYRDYNTALAYAGLGRNANALAVLEKVPVTAESDYLRAILFCREGNVARAVECYRSACRLNPVFVHRGNLDPEISSLVRLYGLNTGL